MQVVGNATSGAEGAFQPLQPLAPGSRDFVSGLCLETEASAENKEALDVATDRLLSVGEVAERLRVTNASVYKLCARGALRHVRILNVIRVSLRDLRSYLEEHVVQSYEPKSGGE